LFQWLICKFSKIFIAIYKNIWNNNNILYIICKYLNNLPISSELHWTINVFQRPYSWWSDSKICSYFEKLRSTATNQVRFQLYIKI